MEQQDYHCSFVVDVTPEEAFENIKDVTGWWARHLEGSSQHKGDTFTVRFGETFVTFRVAEMILHKRIVWFVTDCNLEWIDKKKEWQGDRIEFVIAEAGDRTEVSMTHHGLLPTSECYEDCRPGWNEHFGKSLPALMMEGKGMPV